MGDSKLVKLRKKMLEDSNTSEAIALVEVGQHAAIEGDMAVVEDDPSASCKARGFARFRGGASLASVCCRLLPPVGHPAICAVVFQCSFAS
jgi:hypothetical protein